ncbi:MAG: hypothetical protein EP343_20410 [Deltaproteobacteria bacterium]|nr:MAG: hypothetical protein EP343_20410 [Deltaproteobacteria bacterium]
MKNQPYRRTFLLFVGVLFVALTLAACGNGNNGGEGSGPEPAQQDSGPDDNTSQIDAAPTCKGNNDGVIESSEVTFALGVSVNVLRNKPGTVVAVDHVGKLNDKQVRVWDFRELQADTFDKVRTVDPTGKWFLSTFPEANLLVPISFTGIEGTTYQVLRYSGDLLLLEGVASDKETPEAQKVLLPYDNPIPLLRFPLRDGKNWIVKANTKGNVGTLPVSSADTYDIKVEGRGSLILPNIQFDNTLRIFTTVRQRLIGGQTRQLYQVLFFHECFGEVARVESKDNESNAEFNRAPLVRFISF